MFKIGLRSGAPVSVGHMIEVAGSEANEYHTKPGELICIINGTTGYVTGGECPDAVVSEAEYEGTFTKRAIAMLLTPDMFLEAPVKGTDKQIMDLKAGEFIGFDAVSVDAATTSEYCQVIDTLGAKTKGDPILVRFMNNNKKVV